MRSILNLIFLFLLLTSQIALAGSPSKALIIPIKGEVNPVLVSFVKDELERAGKDEVSFIILELKVTGDYTPALGHLTKALGDSGIPVISFVPPDAPAPSLARTILVESSPLAVMAPETIIGNGKPEEEIGLPVPPEEEAKLEKLQNEQIVLLKSLASKNGRKTDWVEDLVRKDKTWSATEAKKLGAIELVAENLETLLEKVHGRKIKSANGPVTLDTKKISLSQSRLPEILETLQTMSDPNVINWMIIGGIALLFMDLVVFGAVVPGAIGVICVIWVLFAWGIITPVTAGWTFIIIGLILLVLEGVIMAMGMIALCGVVSLIFGVIIQLGIYFPDLLIRDTTILVVISACILGALILFALFKKLVRRFSKPEDQELPA